MARDIQRRRESQRRAAAKWYLNNKAKRFKANRKVRAGLRVWFQEYKATLCCERCGENHPACLDFHHLNPAEKDFNISEMLTKYGSKKRILEEVAKCVVLCSNCHRKEHYRDVSTRQAGIRHPGWECTA